MSALQEDRNLCTVFTGFSDSLTCFRKVVNAKFMLTSFSLHFTAWLTAGIALFRTRFVLPCSVATAENGSV